MLKMIIFPDKEPFLIEARFLDIPYFEDGKLVRKTIDMDSDNAQFEIDELFGYDKAIILDIED
jgi:hypothetical protein